MQIECSLPLDTQSNSKSRRKQLHGSIVRGKRKLDINRDHEYTRDPNSSSHLFLKNKMRIINFGVRMTLAIIVFNLVVVKPQAQAQAQHTVRMVRLCIASADPIKLSSQCVMCNRREFPLTVIDCTGMTKVNDLISNPLSVQEATCLIYNCRKQVPGIKPEPYAGSISSAERMNHPIASGSRAFESFPSNLMSGPSPVSPHMSRYTSSGLANTAGYSGYGTVNQSPVQQMSSSSISQAASRALVGGPNVMANGQQLLPYALVPASYTSFLGSRKYKAALVPLF